MPNLALLALEASDGTVVLTSITLVFAMLALGFSPHPPVSVYGTGIL